jgi:hypothetical protein
LRWSRTDTHLGSGDAGGGGATPAYPFANEGRYSDPYSHRVADAGRYAAGNSNPNGDAFSKVDCYTPFAHPDAPADGYNHRHTDTNAGSHAYAYTDLASDDL